MKALTRPSSLAQAFSPVTVVVTDFSGKPVEGAEVQSGQERQITNGNGMAFLEYTSPNQEVVALYEDLVASASVGDVDLSRGDTVFINFPVTIPGPLLRPIDLAILGGAAALTLAGIHYKSDALKTVGEVVFGAGAFGIIYRLSCI